jgi:chromatin remodeling complex protein RSC6
MSSSIQNPSMSSAAKSVVPKKVEKKDAKVVTAPVAAAAASEAAAPVPKKAAKKAEVEPSSAATVPAVTAQPVVADALAVEEKSWQEELKLVQDQLSAIGRAVAAALSASKRLERRANRDVKDAKKGKRKQRAPLAEGEERKPSIFQIPVPVSDELSVFLGGGKNNLMSRSQVTKAISAYVKENKLNDKHKVNPNAALRKLLGVKEGDELTIFNMQTYLQPHYIKVAKPVA